MWLRRAFPRAQHEREENLRETAVLTRVRFPGPSTQAWTARKRMGRAVSRRCRSTQVKKDRWSSEDCARNQRTDSEL